VWADSVPLLPIQNESEIRSIFLYPIHPKLEYLPRDSGKVKDLDIPTRQNHFQNICCFMHPIPKKIIFINIVMPQKFYKKFL